MRSFVRIAIVYIDLLLLLTVSGLVNRAFALVEWPGDLLAWGIALGTAVVLQFTGLSPGRWLAAPLAEAVEMSPRPGRLWANTLVGTLLVLEATKQLVRWTQMERPFPFFGMILEGDLQIIISIVLGLILLVIGTLILRLRSAGVYAALMLGVIWVISMVTSRPILAEVIERMVVARRAAQSFPVRDGEIEMMQTIMPGAWLIGAVILMIMIALCHRRPSVGN